MHIIGYLTLQAAEGAEGPAPQVLTLHGGLMIWTLLIFLTLLFVLSRYAFKPITAAVERRDREEAAKQLAEQRAAMDKAHAEAMQVVAEARVAAEQLRREILSQARVQGQELLDRARHEIDAERRRAIAELRREAIDLAIVGAEKVIEKNLDEPSNRALVEKFLATLDSSASGR
jgi:F-type H+-transporting ATPase subunit b